VRYSTGDSENMNKPGKAKSETKKIGQNIGTRVIAT
jgi:hypothetical protein